MSFEVALLRIVGPALILISARLCGRATVLLTILLVGGLLVAPPSLPLEGERHGRGTQVVLVIECAVLGFVMRFAACNVRAGTHS